MDEIKLPDQTRLALQGFRQQQQRAGEAIELILQTVLAMKGESGAEWLLSPDSTVLTKKPLEVQK